MALALPKFRIELDGGGKKSRVWMDGVELKGVRDIKVDQQLGCAPVVTISFLAGSVSSAEVYPPAAPTQAADFTGGRYVTVGVGKVTVT